MGADEKTSTSRANVQKRLFEIMKTETDPRRPGHEMREAVKKIVSDSRPRRSARRPATSTRFAEAQVKMLESPWFRFFLTFDPRPTLAKVRCPVLALNGEKDLQVPPKENLAEIAKALKKGGNTRVTTKELPGLNHLFQTCKTGVGAEYAQIEETIAPAALKVIGDWVVEQVK